MSIYSTWLWLTDQLEAEGRGEADAPWIYEGSHVLPVEEGTRGGALEIGVIPNHIDRSTLGKSGPGMHDWLRIGVAKDDEASMQTVVLNRAQVERVRDTLTDWLERPSGVDE